jgi:hypothetical protein
MYQTFRRFLGFGLLGIMLATAVVPTIASAQGRKGGKKSGGKKAGKKGGGKGAGK